MKESFLERFNRQYGTPVVRSAPLYATKDDPVEETAADNSQLTPRNYDELEVLKRLRAEKQKSEERDKQPQKPRKKYIYHSIMKSNKTYRELMSKNASLLHQVGQALAHDE